MIYDKEVETRPVAEQYELDREQYKKQIAYLFENSTFYQRKLAEAGFSKPEDVGGLEDIAQLHARIARIGEATRVELGIHVSLAKAEVVEFEDAGNRPVHQPERINVGNLVPTQAVHLDQSPSSPGATMIAWVYPTNPSTDPQYVISGDDGGHDWSILSLEMGMRFR